MDEQQIFASITAKGVAKASFTSVTYSATVRATDKTGPAAKAKARPVIAQLMAAIDEACKTGAGIDKLRLRTDMSISAVSRYNDKTKQHEHAGYQATFTVNLDGSNVAMATKVHDALTSIEGVESPTPVFNIAGSAALEAEAFADGFAKAQERIGMMCKTAGLAPTRVKIVGLSQGDDRAHRGKTMALAAYDETHAGAPVEIEPGQAEFVVQVTVRYAYA